ncbi:MAG: ThuA domain-containing protein [Planctomycetes bacterium]|nr:ThuA domain-containing protein [Planctomycetota bacterium]
MRWLLPCLFPLTLCAQEPKHPALTLAGDAGPLRGSHVVFVAGDEEYRSEQSLPQLARILAFRLGARCSVVLPIDPRTGAIDPGVTNNLPGLDALRTADLLVLLTRFRALDDADMQQFADFVDAGKPIVALRTSTHAFALPQTSKFAAWSWNAPDGGFGRRVLGETWIAHHGQHGVQGTRGQVAPGADQHVILRGIDAAKVFDPADVYRVRLPLPDGCVPLLLGEVLQSMAPDALPVPDQGERMPILWTRELPVAGGERRQRVVTTTLGSAAAFAHGTTRRLFVNACLWALGRDAAIRSDLDVALVGDYEPRAFGFGKHAAGERPADLVWPRTPLPKPEK